MASKGSILLHMAAVVVVVSGQGVIPGVPNFCIDPPQKGICRANIPSFHYDSETRTCDCFVYGGCMGNDNRFSTLAQCMETCGVNPTLQENTDRCDQVLGNSNPLAKKEVLDAIKGMIPVVPEDAEEAQQVPPPPLIPDYCFDPPEAGFCRAYIPSFHYDSETRTCDCFVYGGCMGNDNRFSTLDECLLTCGVRPSRQQNTANCDRVLGSNNPLAKKEVLDAIRETPQPKSEHPQQPTQQLLQPQQLQHSQQPSQQLLQPQQPSQQLLQPQQPSQQLLQPQQPSQQLLQPQQPSQQLLQPQQPSQQPCNHHSNSYSPSNHHSNSYNPSNHHSNSYNPSNHHSNSYTPSNHHSNFYTPSNHHSNSYTPSNHHSNPYNPSNHVNKPNIWQQPHRRRGRNR
ncbi:regulator of nonsense transcripts 1-like [Homarus americanus]|uniref:Tissue factor pathway inhibitor-like 4 n=1 Tax=Homarus americanus TaxID=6706 RepID=A0A8J5N1K5_HOMAM|nr:regulator of nonsense transcripts 1-like [Homarus americanus]KAG7171485.1 Tissue factor pathway inhibitor-like 4 [Homarus americanus]